MKNNKRPSITIADYTVIGASVLMVILAKIGLHYTYDNTLCGLYLSLMIFSTGVGALRLMQVVRDW